MKLTALLAAPPTWALWLLAAPAYAHVELHTPNGGELFEAGDTVTIEWEILLSHPLENWDLWYSTTGADGPWKKIVKDLAPGSGDIGSVHTFDWVVPPTPSTDVYVRVRMDNAGQADHEDKSDSAFTIDAALGVDVDKLSISEGGTQTLTLDPGPAFAGGGAYLYLVLGSTSGTAPGLPLGAHVLPLNPDVYTVQTLTKPNQFPLVDSFGSLDADGMANALFSARAGELPAGLAGLEVNHAFLIFDPSAEIVFASNATTLTLKP